MKVFTHRVNDCTLGNISGVYGAELDIHINDSGRIVAKHNPCFNNAPPVEAKSILEDSGYDKFFVDIKQNLDVNFLEKIVEVFGNKLHALFDVPFPSAYYAVRAGIPVYDRFSEFEQRLNFTNRFWLDPLVSCTVSKYQSLLSLIPKSGKVIICSPELHGQDTVTDVWRWIENQLKINDLRIEGIVTKFPSRAMDFFGEYTWNA